ncbi:MAG TPA: hypothetical protein DEV73_03770 [Candidatus Zambryskibacteria bacterium]|nr:hypothetical protein [Candidatus Zambryskibacteria bacterium]
MWIRSGNNAVQVTPSGSVNAWQNEEHFILGPARYERVGERVVFRGECHWCAPNYGPPPPAYAKDQPKHGKLRSLVLPSWISSDTAVFGTLDLSRNAPMPALDLPTEVRVTVKDDCLTTTLSMWNSGNQLTPILPAFHPYFQVPSKGFWMNMNGRDIARAIPCRGEILNISANAHTFKRTGELVVELAGIGRIQFDLPDSCTHIVLWSDQPAKYVCVEPVFGSPGSFGAQNGTWLKPAESGSWEVRMTLKRF